MHYHCRMNQRRLRFIFISILSVCFSHPKAQNLVPDSSFEHNSSIPTILSSIGANASWSAPTMGTTDLFCECNKKLQETSEAQVPRNPMGIQKANTGKCYAGFYLFSHGDYREYLLTQLMQPLQGGTIYELYLYLSLSDYSRAAIEQIGVCFLKSKVTYTSSNVIGALKPQYFKIKEEVGKDTINWHQIIIEYKAKGGEQFLLIGSFDIYDYEATNVKAPKGVRTRINQRTERDAYYYIDDVSLREQTPPRVAVFDTIVIPKIDTIKTFAANEPKIDTSGNATPIKAELDKALVLKNVLFETGKAVLLPSSFSELDILIWHLNNNPLFKIEIAGYTDNVGNEIQNAILSEQRAKAVCDYLITKSIDPGRITHKGYGSTNAIAPNETEEGRKQNRRVEFKFFR